MSHEIRSPQNERVKRIVRLQRDAAARREFGLTVVEGSREVVRALENGWVPTEIYVALEQTTEDARALALDAEQRGISVFRCSSEAFGKLSYRENPDGLLAVGPSVGRTLDDLVLPPNPFLLVAENVEKPGNLGALLRTADGAGVHAVIACDPATDLGNPNLIRSSVGTVFYLPVAQATSEDAARWLNAQHIRVVTTEPAAEMVHTDADLTGPLAIVVGAEDAGVSSVWQRAADVRVRIPMLGRNDSLNVSVAAAVLLYEVVRQRRSNVGNAAVASTRGSR
jgi:RNA methyltransferase, TrmH family